MPTTQYEIIWLIVTAVGGFMAGQLFPFWRKQIETRSKEESDEKRWWREQSEKFGTALANQMEQRAVQAEMLREIKEILKDVQTEQAEVRQGFTRLNESLRMPVSVFPVKEKAHERPETRNNQ